MCYHAEFMPGQAISNHLIRNTKKEFAEQALSLFPTVIDLLPQPILFHMALRESQGLFNNNFKNGVARKNG